MSPGRNKCCMPGSNEALEVVYTGRCRWGAAWKPEHGVFAFGRCWQNAVAEVVCSAVRTGLGLRGQRVRGRLLCEPLALTDAVVFASSTLHATFLSVRTAHDAVGSPARLAKVKEDREVRRCQTYSSRVHEPSMCVDAWP